MIKLLEWVLAIGPWAFFFFVLFGYRRAERLDREDEKRALNRN